MCRLLTPHLEEVLKDYPLYSQDGKGKEAVCIAIFAIGSVRWFILEGETERDDTLFRHRHRVDGGRVWLYFPQ